MEVVRKQLKPIMGNGGSRKTTKINCGWWKLLKDGQSLLLKLKEVSPYLEELHRVKMESTLKEEDEITCA